MKEYIVLTQKSILDMEYENEKQWEQDCLALYEEQNAILKANGIENDDVKSYIVHFFDSDFFDEQTTELTIDDAIQCLAIKDGVDLVQYENGNYGYVAYYGTCDNGFEILGA